MSSKIRIATKILKDLFSLYSIPFSIRESGPLGDLNLTVKVDSSKFHMLGSNYDSNYYKFFEEVEDEIIESLELVGLEEDFDKIIFKHVNYKFMEDKILELQGIMTDRLRRIVNGRNLNVIITGPYLQDFRPELVYNIKFPKDLHPDKQKLLMRSIPSVYDDINFHARV
jgi:hypothetical protein